MKIESTEFTEDDIYGFVSQYFELERKNLIRRLEAVADETDALVPAIEERSESAEREWSAIETLAHMAISAQFFGWLVHEVVTKDFEGDVHEMLRLRDVAGSDAAQLSPDVLAKQVRDNIERTVAFIEKVPYDDLRVSIRYGGREMTAEDALRISYINHLEDHVDQIRKAIGSPLR